MESVKVVVVTKFGIGMKDKEWYDYRYNIHRAFGQACMLNQTNQNFEWVICLDTNPPVDFLHKLEDDFKDRENVHLLRIKDYWIDEYRSFINENLLTDKTERLVFARRDDDDAVNINFVQNIYDFLQNNEVELHFVPEKQRVDDGELTARVRPLRASFHWGKLIGAFYKDSPDTLKHLFCGRSGTDIRVYYKNSFVGDVGRIAEHGKVDAQLQKLGERIDKVRGGKEIVPYAIINHYRAGFVFNAQGRNQFWPHYGTLAVACYSILPVENKKMTSFQDSVYENFLGHGDLHLCGPGITYNEMTLPAQYVYIRTQVNDCMGGCRSHSIPRSLDDSLKKAFSITDEGWRLYLDTNTEYEVPRYSADRSVRELRKAGNRVGTASTS